jgi:hypothetical protein
MNDYQVKCHICGENVMYPTAARKHKGKSTTWDFYVCFDCEDENKESKK